VGNKINKRFSGTVMNGEKVGRTIGFPTANLDNVPSEDQLELGSYSGVCKIKGEEYNCLAYFGPRYIFNELKNVFEIFIIDFNADIYNEEITVIVQEYIRKPMRFSSVEDLKNQLMRDLLAAKEIHARTSGS